MQELDSVISAAEEMDAKLNLAAKQVQPSLAAVTGTYAAARKTRGNTTGGRAPYARGGRGNNASRGNNAGRGNKGRVCSHQYSDPCTAAASPAQGANAEPIGEPPALSTMWVRLQVPEHTMLH